MNARVVVVSCPRRKPVQEIWLKTQKANWPDCRFPIDFLSPTPDIGWNANLIRHLQGLADDFILLMLDDHFLCEGPWTENMNTVLGLMEVRPDIGMIKLQAGNAHGPELVYEPWDGDRIREYDREPHPFKRTNLVPTMYRREWLLRLSKAVLEAIDPTRDVGRLGAIEFEVIGTLLTQDTEPFPEKMLGIHRPDPGGNGGNSLLQCMDNDAIREGKIKRFDGWAALCNGVEGIEAFI